jgi:putative redox protein
MQTNEKVQNAESASVSLVSGMHFAGEIDDFRIDIDGEKEEGGGGDGPQPLRLLLLGLAGCTAMDVISILRKKRQEVAGFEVEVHGRRVSEHPRVYESIEILYRVRGSSVESRAVERAIELSENRYCPVIAMVDESVEIVSRYQIEPDD